MKSGRLLEMLLLLQAKSPRPASELATALEVTSRTIYRDVDALGTAGVPIYTIRGPAGGIALQDGYRQAISQLKENEINALFISGADPLVDLGVGNTLARAREKLFGALTDRQRAVALKAGGRIKVDPHQWGQDKQPVETLGLMRIAVWEDRSVEVSYRNQKGNVTPQRLDPLGIVFKAGLWYVVARSNSKVATYRAERMLDAQLLDTRFERPEAFDLGEYWEESVRRYEKKAEPFLVTVLGNKKALEQLAVFWPTQIKSDNSDTQLEAEVRFPLRGLAIRELLAWSADIEALSPASVRQEVASRLQAGLDRYGLARSLE